MSDRSVRCGGGSTGSVFNIFRGSGDRYCHFEEDDDFTAHSPPSTHDFPEPIKFRPRKNNCQKQNDTPQTKNDSRDISNLLPSLEGRFKNILIPGQTSQEQFFPRQDVRRGSADITVEQQVTPYSTLKLFERAQKMTTDVEAQSRLPRRASDTNLLRYSEKSVIVKQVPKIVKMKDVDEGVKVVKPAPMLKTTDDIDGHQNIGVLSTFSGWLLGGSKTIDVQDKDLNVFGPTSY